jgi:Nitrile hydratase, alpha chain
VPQVLVPPSGDGGAAHQLSDSGDCPHNFGIPSGLAKLNREKGNAMANEYVAPSTDGHYLADPQNQQKWAQLVTRAWADESLKQRLLNDPAPLLQEYGIETPAGLELRVVQDKDVIACMVQPQMLAGELTPSQLSGVVGGGKPTGGKPVKYLVYDLNTVVIT